MSPATRSGRKRPYFGMEESEMGEEMAMSPVIRSERPYSELEGLESDGELAQFEGTITEKVTQSRGRIDCRI